jgi:Lrp/AsnC family transcriptional regulator, leucine-responsive regulatory protein
MSDIVDELLAPIYDAPGVVTTRTYIVLSTHVERPVQPDSTVIVPPPRQAQAGAGRSDS